MSDHDSHERIDHLVHAYGRMLERTREGLDRAQEATPKLRDWLEKARDQMVELGELTREEANRIADYLERDLRDAASYIIETGEDLRDWWRFDLKLIEQRLLDAFSSVADQTSLQLRQWAEQARRVALYQAGEITGPGTLICDRCGATTQFTGTGCIPACAQCGNTGFRRAPARAAD